MSSRTSAFPAWNRLLSEALRIIRRARQLRVRDLAAAMGMRLRSYEHFEAGGGRLSLERVHGFAEASRSDPHAIFAAVMIGSPRFALRAADNKLMTAFLIALQEFDSDLGDEIAELDTGAIMGAFTQAFSALTADAKRKVALRDALLAKRWPGQPGGDHEASEGRDD